MGQEKGLYTKKSHAILLFLVKAADQVLVVINARTEKNIDFFQRKKCHLTLHRGTSASSFENLQSSTLGKACSMHVSVIPVHRFSYATTLTEGKNFDLNSMSIIGLKHWRLDGRFCWISLYLLTIVGKNVDGWKSAETIEEVGLSKNCLQFSAGSMLQVSDSR